MTYDTKIATGALTVSGSQTGTLSVTTTPVSGAIYVDNSYMGAGSWNGSVTTGSHTVSFGDVSGYTTPSPQTVTVSAGKTTPVTGTYVAIQNAHNLVVSFSPNPVSASPFILGCPSGDSWMYDVYVQNANSFGVTITKFTEDSYNSQGSFLSEHVNTGSDFTSWFNVQGAYIPPNSTARTEFWGTGSMCTDLGGAPSGSQIWTFYGTGDNGSQVSGSGTVWLNAS